MHNLDRTTLETEGQEFEGNEFEQEQENEQFIGDVVGGLFGEQEFEQEQENEQFIGDIFGETEFEQEEFETETESPFNETEAMELASELLNVTSEQELNYFLGGLLKKGLGAVKRFAKSGVGKSLLGGLKGIAKKALPMVGTALGNMVVPGLGGAIGGKLASGAGKLFGLELEGLSSEDREFEVAKQLVNLAGAAARAAAKPQRCNHPHHHHPHHIAKKALLKAAKVYAPGIAPAIARGALNKAIVRGTAPVPALTTTATGRVVTGGGHHRGGRWIRRGNAIILLGA